MLNKKTSCPASPLTLANNLVKHFSDPISQHLLHILLLQDLQVSSSGWFCLGKNHDLLTTALEVLYICVRFGQYLVYSLWMRDMVSLVYSVTNGAPLLRWTFCVILPGRRGALVKYLWGSQEAARLTFARYKAKIRVTEQVLSHFSSFPGDHSEETSKLKGRETPFCCLVETVPHKTSLYPRTCSPWGQISCRPVFGLLGHLACAGSGLLRKSQFLPFLR